MPPKIANPQSINSTANRIRTAVSSNHSYEIKLAKHNSLNRQDLANSPISNFEHMPKIVEPYKLQLNEDFLTPSFYDKRILSASGAAGGYSSRPYTTNPNQHTTTTNKSTNKTPTQSYVTWKNDLKHIYGHYSIMVSPSYRVASAYVPRPMSELDLQSSQILDDNSRTSLDMGNNNNTTATNPTTHPNSNSPQTNKDNSNNSTPTNANHNNTVQYSISTSNSGDSKQKTTKLDMFLIPSSLVSSRKNSHNRLRVVSDAAGNTNT